ncbi:MAG: dihydrolipoyllysine-residue acetyltransferase [Burkholderiaceae bacterium]
MSEAIEIKVPDIGDFDQVEVIEVLVKPGDSITVEQSLITVESDKASMEIPSPVAGVVADIRVSVGDQVKQGSVIVTVQGGAGAVGAAAPAVPEPAVPEAAVPEPAAGADVVVAVPDIGDFDGVEVIEVLVKPGDVIAVEQSLVTVESDKASMEIPSPHAGTVAEVLVTIGETVSEGMPLVRMSVSGDSVGSAGSGVAVAAPPAAQVAFANTTSASEQQASKPVQTEVTSAAPVSAPVSRIPPVAHNPTDISRIAKPHASPSVRAFARELGVDLHAVRGSGPKQRIVRDDVSNHVKSVMSGQASSPVSAGAANDGAGLGLIPWPKVDFAKFGPVQSQKLSRIKKVSAANLHRNWVMIPHVTNNDDADITDLEAFRVLLNKENEKAGAKVTMLAFIVKACVAALKRFPEFNASLDGDNIVLKQYYNIGVAADTPNGLVVPVIKNADQKGVLEIAQEMRELAGKAREGKIKPDEMQGGTFSISSLGGIGGTYFTPIINAPEVAILGVCRAAHRPVWDGSQFVPRLMLPMSLSWDHRVIDGAAAARFNAYLGQVLADFRRTML